MSRPLRYFLLWKPYDMLSQFTREDGHRSLADLAFQFPKDVYPVGRLDRLSEGLLLLTNDASLNSLLLAPKNKVQKTYLVLLDGNATLDALQKEMNIRVKGISHSVRFEEISLISKPEVESIPLPIRERNPSKLTWCKVTISEGKNRQIRKMTGTLGFPALRVIRIAIGGLQPCLRSGEVQELSRAALVSAIGID